MVVTHGANMVNLVWGQNVNDTSINHLQAQTTGESVRQTRQLCSRFARLLMAQIELLGQPEAVDEAQTALYARYFGKDAPLAGLTKLVSLHKSLIDLEAEAQKLESQKAEMLPAHLTDTDWELLGRCVDRYREHAATQPTSES